MPSVKKVLHFISSAAFCAGGVGVLGYGMSVDWSSTEVDCFSENSTGSGMVAMGLFVGEMMIEACPFLSSSDEIDVMKKMTGAPLILQYLAVVLLAFALLGSAGSLLITLYNSFSNPYETYMGPVGLYACGSFSVIVSFLGLIVYVCNVHLNNFAEEWIRDFAAYENITTPVVNMEVGFFLVLPYMAMNLLAILLVYLYVHAAYTRKKEQQKTTEDAPKDIMLY